MNSRRATLALALGFAAFARPQEQFAPAVTNSFFKIQVVDDETGRSVPLVELRTVNSAAWWTDSNGLVAFDEPGLMDREVYFHVSSPGYEFAKDFFGNRGVKLKPAAGASAQIKLKRFNIAERLYRITGQGIYRDSALLRHPVPLRHPVLNAQVMGQDTVIATPYHGKIYWFWGDTDRASYPLGNFGASGATSELPGRGGLDPSVGVELAYFTDAKGFSKPMCPLPGSGLRWIEGLLTVPDDKGTERLVARVANVRDLSHVNDWHLMLFDDDKETFESIQRWEIHEGHESAHPFRARVHGVDYFYLYPNSRVRAELQALRNLNHYEAFTCVAGDGKLHGAQTEIDRDAAGQVRYSWKAGADRLHHGRVRELISAGKLRPGESWLELRDIETGSSVPGGRGSVFWNRFRERWVMIGSGKAGEIWFSEGDTPLGPWAYARRVVTHGEYNFYNPTQHPFFDQDGGRVIYFEGTYTASFSGARSKTPRYDYNQIMYRLRLDDERLSLPAPVYRVKTAEGKPRWLLREGVEAQALWKEIEEVGFFAIPPARRRNGLIPIFAGVNERGSFLDTNPPAVESTPLFFALPATDLGRAGALDGIWQCAAKTKEGGELAFGLEMKERGEDVEASSEDGRLRGSGTLRKEAFEMRLTNGPVVYLLSGTLRAQKFAGEWRRADASESGTWSARRTRVSEMDTSPAIVPLYEFRRATDGQSIYSTKSDLSDTSFHRGAEPLCRVWPNPGTALTLDFDAQPVATTGAAAAKR
jgi:hypothetical protein